MDALDGNAIAGHLHELFGVELTTASGTCASCGATGPIAELTVYISAGAVARCRSCESVVMAVVTVRGATRVDLRGMAALTMAGQSESIS
jgi:uncharacterized protein DUF6510